MHFPYVPFSQLLPQSAVLVHHGGIGSTAQALAAGIPQLIMAMAFDQPDNANRVHRLGVGDGLFRREFQVAKVKTMLEHLLGSKEIAVRCKQLAARFEAARPREAAAERIEQLLRRVPPAMS